jgi:hypothetical protein
MFISNFSKNSTKFRISHFSKKALSFGILSILSVLSIFPTNLQVHAGNESLYKSQKADFVVEYSNVGDAIATTALLSTKIGDKLEVDTSSFTDQYGDGQIYCVSPSVFITDKTVVGSWGSFINYRPRSAETTEISTCKGVSTPGTVDLGSAANGTAKKGYFRFKATLKSTITDPIGTILTTDANQGTFSRLTLDDKRPSVVTENSITIIANPKPLRSNLAKPDDTKKTGGDFDGTKPQPIYTSMIFDPNPGITKQIFRITTNGLLDSGTSETLENATCQTTLKGQNYQFSANGNVVKGSCQVNFAANETPTSIGDYQAVTKVKGPNGDLWTKPENVKFDEIVKAINITVRTGGENLLIGTGIVTLIIGTAYYLSKKQKMRY